MPACGGAGGVEAGLADVRLARDFTDAGQAFVCVDANDEDVERAVGDFFNDGDTEVDRFDGGDFHGRRFNTVGL